MSAGYNDDGFRLGGSCVVISRVIRRVTMIMTHIRGLISHTHEPPSTPRSRMQGCGFRIEGCQLRVRFRA